MVVFHPKLNIALRSIANKYRDGKVKRTLERELKVPEIVELEADWNTTRYFDFVQFIEIPFHYGI